MALYSIAPPANRSAASMCASSPGKSSVTPVSIRVTAPSATRQAISLSPACRPAYAIADLTPGKYKLLAVDADGLVAYQRGIDVEDYEDIAESLDLQAGDKIVKDLRR